MGLKATAFVVAVLAAFAASFVANADGEAGLVVDHGDGRVDTYCVAFEGDDISGEALLARAGIDVNDMGGLVCAIGGTGCGTGDDCLCQCKSGGSDCVYWAFFTQRYGETWVYSALGYRAQKARDGDLHAWKWGKGSSRSAPAPAAITFEQVCGHPPAFVSHAPTNTPIATITPIQSNTPPAPVGTPASATSPTIPPPGETPRPSPGTSPTSRPTSLPTAPTPAAPGSTPRGASTPPAAPTDGPTDGSTASVAAFAGVAGTLLVALGAAIFWRRRHGR